jgi:hypothetical protein
MSVVEKYLTAPDAVETSVSPLQDLADICTEISNEAFSVNNVGDYFTRKGAKLSVAVREAFRYITTRDYRKPEQLNASQLARMLRTVHYTELANDLAYQPLGFTGNLCAYTTELNGKPLTYVLGLINEVLIPAQRRFAYYLNNPGEYNERREFEAGSKYTLQMLEELKRDEGKWMTLGNHSSTAAFGELFDNNGEIVKTCELLNNFNDKRWVQAAPQKIEQEVNKLVKISGALFENLSRSAQDAASAQFINMLATEISTVAKWMEWYAVMTTRVMDATTAMKENEKTLMAL